MIPPSAFPNPDLATILVANRGEIACRILATIRAMGLRGVAIYSEADRDARHVAMADEAYCVGPPAVAESYLDIDRILEVARRTGSQAIHPGYGLLSENVTFAQACQEAGVAFIGPRPEQIDCFGLKDRARAIAREQGVPLLEGTELLRTEGAAFAAAGRIGYPVILKAAAGGGGIGMQRCDTLSELREAYASVGRLAESNFGSADVFLEKFIVNARHIEVQVFGDGEGKVCVLGERDCSTQRRNQKVIEETPAPGLPQAKREECWECARRLAAAVDYRSAGTVEFLYDADEEQFYFLEVNTRLQVEHGVTEMVTHVDLVGWMIRLALGDNPIAEEPLSLPVEGHAIEVRIYAEDPHKDFQPSSGLLTQVSYPPEVRSDYWVESGTEVTPFYDPLLAKVLVNAGTREEAVGKLKQALAQTEMAGIETNLLYLRQIVAWERFGEGGMTTRALGEFHFEPATIDVLSAGIQTTIQDYPGRVGYWNVGVPPSGPMDSLSFRLLNRLVGNEEGVAGLEMTMSGPTLRFNRACCIALGGAEMGATLDGQAVESWSTIAVTAGQILAVGTAEGLGARGYLVVSGGLEVPEYLGSRSTFILGQFGGHGGRALRVGDVLHLGSPPGDGAVPPSSLAPAVIPVLTHEWEIGVMYGPHGAPDFFKVEDLEMILGTAWEVHHHSARTGLRLVGPKPSWARSDGGEAGLHPSNIHDNAYAFGTLDFTGDMPVILGPDGPSLGGFVCPVTIVQSELWKTGQLRPGDKVRFFLLSQEAANQREKALDAVVASLEGTVALSTESRIQVPTHSGVVKELPQEEGAPQVVFRAAGDRFLLMEFGPLELDLALRFKVQAVFERLRREAIEGVIDLTPGIRSLQVHYDSRVLSLERLIEQIEAVEEGLTKTEEVEVPSRIVHLPLAWDDEETQKAIQKYVTTVNPEAPWCPSNIEFIRRINGLATQEEVKEILYGASYLVMGLGDVYLGAPVATPLDPRQRLVTTKYNPARTWTPENAVGIGGAYLCIYGMEGPGGYQFVGRTVQMWNRFRSTQSFPEGKPWLLNWFDQIRFYPVEDEELKKIREDFPQGRWHPHVEETSLCLADYLGFLRENAASIEEAKARQAKAFEAERLRWETAGQSMAALEVVEDDAASQAAEVPEGWFAIENGIPASVWQWRVAEGEKVVAGQTVCVLEAMKMEITVAAPQSGTLGRVFAREGKAVLPGEVLGAIQAEEEK